MDSEDRPRSGRSHRRERIHQRHQTERQLALVLSIGGGAVALLIFLVIVLSSRSSERRTTGPRKQVVVLDEPKPERDALPPLPPEERDVILKGRREEPEKKSRPLYGAALRETINKAYLAAKARADRFAQEGRWGDAVKAIEQVVNHYEDHELILRSQADLDSLYDQARDAYKAKKAEAERLAEAARYDEARDLLLKIADSFGIERYTEEARKRAQELFDKKWAEAEADYQQRIAPINADILEWKFDQALDAASKLQFKYEKYQNLLAQRIERIRGLIAMRKKLMDTVNGALPRLKKRDLRAPGLEGELVDATVEGIGCETERGKEHFPWTKFGPEGTMRLALLAGKEKDADHRLWVARLLMEVGYLKRAREELDLARRLGAKTAEDDQDLQRREQAAGQPKED